MKIRFITRDWYKLILQIRCVCYAIHLVVTDCTIRVFIIQIMVNTNTNNYIPVYVFIVTDPRVENWLMMQSYVPTLCVVGIYLVMAITGPRIMASRKPINVQLPMLIYNLGLVVLSVYMFYEVSVIILLYQPIAYTVYMVQNFDGEHF